jgi:hypothetical protein
MAGYQRVRLAERKHRRPAHTNVADLSEDELLKAKTSPAEFVKDFGDVGSLSPGNVQHLQRTIGNRAVTRLLNEADQHPSLADNARPPFPHLVGTALPHTAARTPAIQRARVKNRAATRAGLPSVTPATGNVVQRGLFGRIKRWLGKGWRLAIEATAHFIQGIIQAIAGFGATMTAVGALPGIVAGISGIVQIVIGISKSVRAHILRTKNKATSAFNKLIGFEAVLGTLSAISGIVSGAISLDAWKRVAEIIFKSADTIGGIIKFVRSFLSDKPGMKRVKGILIMIESGIGFLTGLGSSIAQGIGKGAGWILKVIASVIKKIITLFKGRRGQVTAAAEGQEAEARQAVKG